MVTNWELSNQMTGEESAMRPSEDNNLVLVNHTPLHQRDSGSLKETKHITSSQVTMPWAKKSLKI